MGKQILPALPTADLEFTPHPVAQITPIDYISLLPWSHIRFILDKGYSPEKSFFEKEFYPCSINPLLTSQENSAMKIIRDKQIFILRGDKTYTLQGQEVK